MPKTEISVFRDSNNNIAVLSDGIVSGIADKGFIKTDSNLITYFETDIKPLQVIIHTWRAFKNIVQFQKQYPYGLHLVK